MKNYQEILLKKAKYTENIIGQYKEISPKSLVLFQEINKKIKNVTPEIMVYGIYNAGKSSILNELIGENKAKVQDIPTTDSVDYYSFNGYKIADTPGVFAPIEHEEVTEEHLKKADIVLFVMSTTGSNEKAENYKRMKLIDQAGKKIIIVLNDKNGDMGKNDQVISEIKAKVHQNMRQLGIENVNEKYQIITVNAKRAKTGREKNKPSLIARSGINELKQVIEIELKNTNSFDIFQNAIYEIESILKDLADKLSKKSEGLSKELNKIQELLENINDEDKSIKRCMNRIIDRKSMDLKSKMPGIIFESYKNGNTEERIKEEIENFAKEIEYQFQEKIKEKIKTINEDIKTTKNFFNETKTDDKNIEQINEIKNLLDNLSKIGKSLETNLDINIQNTDDPNMAGKITGGLLTTAGLVEVGSALVMGTGEIGGLLTGLLGLAGEAITPFIGPILAIGGAILFASKLFNSNKEKNRQIEEAVRKKNEEIKQAKEREENIKQELTQKSQNLIEDIKTKFQGTISQKIDKIISQYTNLFKQQFSSKKTAESQLNLDIQRIREIISEYRDIKTELGAKEVELA